MPDAARLFEQLPAVTPAIGPSWSGAVHGEVGAMHRAIKQQLLSSSFDLAVVPISIRPAEELIARISRVAGWLTLTGAAAGVVTTLFMLLG